MDFAYLRNIPVFEDLSPADLNLINQATTEQRFGKNETVFVEGEPGEGFHYIKSGNIKIVKQTADGREHILNILGPGEVFAEVLLFNDAPYPATAMTVEESVIGVIGNRKLEALLVQHPQIAVHLIRVMSKKLLFIQTKVKSFALADSLAKVAQTVENLARRYGKKTARGIEVSVDINRQDVANLAGTTRETLSRMFGLMKKDGVIGDDERRIIVLDMDGLKRYYEEQMT